MSDSPNLTAKLFNAVVVQRQHGKAKRADGGTAEEWINLNFISRYCDGGGANLTRSRLLS